MNVGARELRARLKYYLDQLEAGEEIVIIRNSAIIGHIVPEHPAPPQGSATLDDDRRVLFRSFKPADREAVKRLHELALREVGAFSEGGKSEALDLDLEDIEGYYVDLNGEFLVGELDGEIVAMGGFRMAIEAGMDGVAELKRMRVRPDLWGQGIGGALLTLLESRAAKQGYQAIILDTVAGTPAEKFYQRHGYHETHRQQDGRFELVFYKKEL